MCAVLGLITVVALWAVLGVQRAQVPYVYTSLIGGLSEEQEDMPTSAAAGIATSGLQGITVLTTAASASGTCSNVTWEAVGLSAGSFRLQSSSSCGMLAQHEFTCPDCLLRSGSRLLVRLPWTCQAIALQAYGVSAVGGVTTWSAIAAPDVDPVSSGFQQNAVVRMLSRVVWGVMPMLTMQVDMTRSTPARARGYQVLGGDLDTSVTRFYADAFLPTSTDPVDVVVDLSPAAIYQEVVMTEREPLDAYITRCAPASDFSFSRLHSMTITALGAALFACAPRISASDCRKIHFLFVFPRCCHHHDDRNFLFPQLHRFAVASRRVCDRLQHL